MRKTKKKASTKFTITVQKRKRLFEFTLMSRGKIWTPTLPLIYHYPGAVRPVIIPKYKEVPAFVIKNNMRVIGMGIVEYFELLEMA